MKKTLLLSVLLAVGMAASAQTSNQDVEVAKGQFAPEWESLSAWECPEWFKDAKFGIWAHWGPQCHAEAGDWYARFMYYAGSGQYNWHVSHFGNPKDFGLKDLCNDWKAQNWNPEELVNLYKSVGARYFMALGNHHDNFDLWNSPYQEWNSVNVGPKKDLVGGWREACKKAGLPLGVSIHASHAWTWLEPSQNYDGNLTKADGAGQWWEGMDPQELYAQNHAHSTGWDNSGTIHSQWNWGNGASLPSQAYKQKFQNRVLELIDDYQPDMIYFDDTAMPFYGCDDEVGQNILAHYYNKAASWSGNTPQVVVTGKQLTAEQKGYMMWDVERGIPDRMQDIYWQTCTCIGSWHYDQAVYNNNGYKSGATVIRMLVDVVSKNGNLLLSIPVKSDGTIDDKERKVLADIKAWMDINSESIYGTRTWKTFGEGPLAEAVNPMNAQGFNEGQAYSARDVRYVKKDGAVYATIMAWPQAGTFSFKAMGYASTYYSGKVKSVRLLGYGDVAFTQDLDGLNVTVPSTHPNEIAPVFVITFDAGDSSQIDLNTLLDLLEQRIAELRPLAGYNTGKLNLTKLNALAALVEQGRAGSEEVTLESLRAAYTEFLKSGAIGGGQPDAGYVADLTTEQLIEASAFSRASAVTTRFAAPKYWTVENFSIPNGGDGTKQGLDKYPGYECLYLGLWNDRQNNQQGDLRDARIYRKVHLKPGRYYFGAAYNTTYSLTDQAWLFVAESTLSSDELPTKSMAHYAINNAPDDNSNTLYGLFFTLDKEQDVLLGFQANLSEGSATQEFRAKRVQLLYYGEVTNEKLSQLIDEAETFLKGCIISENTGYYSAEAVATLQASIDAAKSALDGSADLLQSYELLKDALSDFRLNGRNAGGEPVLEGSTDLTTHYLLEADHFARQDASVTTRFAAPKNWTVDNFRIPNGGDGTKQGLDKYPGYDCLMLGVWNDRGSNQQGDLRNARISRTVTLPAGKYYFGATYEANYQLQEAYIFAATEALPTSDISTRSIAFDPIADAGKDNVTFRGITFTLTEEQPVVLGFQADLANGSSTQEFRASSVKLLAYANATAIQDNGQWSMINGQCKTEDAVYDLQGRRQSPSTFHFPPSSTKNIYIQNGKKIINR